MVVQVTTQVYVQRPVNGDMYLTLHYIEFLQEKGFHVSKSSSYVEV